MRRRPQKPPPPVSPTFDATNDWGAFTFRDPTTQSTFTTRGGTAFRCRERAAVALGAAAMDLELDDREQGETTRALDVVKGGADGAGT